jgi:hypothetical protein
MTIVLAVGFGFAALRNADRFWASAAFTLAIAAISIALTVAITRKGRTRTAWAGFAVFGWVYLLIVLLPPRHTGGFGFGPMYWPPLLVEWGLVSLQPYLHPLPPGAAGGLAGDLLTPYDQVSHSLGVILFGLVGAVLGRLFAAKDDERNP